MGIPDGAVNAATPMVDCYSAKSGRFARNLELLGPIAHWLGRALLIRGLPPPTACPTPTSVPAAPGPNLTPVKPERREGLNCKKSAVAPLWHYRNASAENRRIQAARALLLFAFESTKIDDEIKLREQNNV